MSTGKFIVLEGLDFSGKTTLAGKLTAHLNSIGIKTVHTSCSSDDNPLSKVIRTHVLQSEQTPSVDTQAMLYAACINDLVDRVLLPNINEGTWVICERYTLSNKVYQTHSLITSGLANGIDRRLLPDLTFVLDITPQVYMERVIKRGKVMDNLEQVDETILNQRRKQYRMHTRADSTSVLLDATAPQDKLLSDALSHILKLSY